MRTKRSWSAMEITMGSLFVAMMTIGANITSIAPFMVVGGVPITLQTFFAILAGLILGSRLGALSLFVYMLLGLIGAPVFAQFKGGLTVLFTPTFGFIVSYILIAYIAGKMAERQRSVKMYVAASLVAMVLNYIIGTNWMYAAYLFWFEAPEGLTYTLVWSWMMVPLPKDIVLSIFAGLLAYRLERSVVRKSSFRNREKIA
ncbi:BioY family transporter [Halobacillus andaensis]|uniref:Biotin transporter n=1 Tax=Halobacillus andaensis TaxID=1176239 RepID=A0A917BB57_HALAA|nr:biotin transporter BioY [Halobacillus andaensis]MBP2006346.1 biotin transport system substrate-specific component [Halobacillus andaensis]GGF34413.1 BioY family transporter [Halobacillus andaensis]